jgi:hypothetical protein
MIVEPVWYLIAIELVGGMDVVGDSRLESVLTILSPAPPRLPQLKIRKAPHFLDPADPINLCPIVTP